MPTWYNEHTLRIASGHAVTGIVDSWGSPQSRVMPPRRTSNVITRIHSVPGITRNQVAAGVLNRVATDSINSHRHFSCGLSCVDTAASALHRVHRSKNDRYGHYSKCSRQFHHTAIQVV